MTFMRLLRKAWPFRWWILLSSVFSTLTVSASVGLMMTSGTLIALAALHPSISVLQVPVVGVRFFGISRAVLRYLERLVTHETTFRLLARFRIWFYRAIEPISPTLLQKTGSGELLGRMAHDVDALEHLYARLFAPPMTALGVAFLMLMLLGWYGFTFWIAFVVPYLAAALVPLLGLGVTQKLATQAADIHGQLQAGTVEILQGRTEWLSLGNWEPLKKQLMILERQLGKITRQQSIITAANEAWLLVCLGLALGALWWIGLPQAASGELSRIQICSVTLGVFAAFEAVAGFAAWPTHLQNSLASAERLYAILPTSKPPQRKPKKNATAVSLQKVPVLEVKNLTLRYQGQPEPVIEGLNLVLHRGECVGIRGPSGIGKSTLVQALCRFLEPEQGKILHSGISLADFREDDLRLCTRVLEQHVHLFTGTLYENLLLGARLDHTYGFSESQRQKIIWDVLEKVGLADWVQTLADGLDSWLGEQGLHASGGQRQRIAAARLLIGLHSHSLIQDVLVVLDEPTSQLDAASEVQLVQAFRSLTPTPTLLVISHRDEVLQAMDRVIDFGHNSVV